MSVIQTDGLLVSSSRGSARRPFSAGLFLGAVAAVTVGYYRLAPGTQSSVYDGVAVAAAAAMFAGIAWLRPEPRFAWTLIAFGVLALAVGDIVYGTSQPVPSPADMLYISAYPLMVLGLVGVVRGLSPGRSESILFDAMVVAAAVGTVAIVFLLVPSGQRGVGMAAKVVSLGYPVLDLGVLALLIRASRRAGHAQLAFGLLLTAIVLRLVADAGFALMNYGTSYSIGDGLDAAWLLSYGCFGAALLLPSLANVRIRIPAARPAPGVVQPPAAPVARARAATVSPAQRVLRFRTVLTWSGAMLLALAGLAVMMAAMWRVPDMIFLAGAYGTIGSLTLIASAV